MKGDEVAGAGFGDEPRQLRKEDFGAQLPGMVRQPYDAEEVRQNILLETLTELEKKSPTAEYHRVAQQNLSRWRAEAKPRNNDRCDVRVLCGDWGEVTGSLVKEYGVIFAALNMANAYGPGGGYAQGMVAQEENMFRRTDCHFSLDRAKMNRYGEYVPDETALLSAAHGKVYLDTKFPRVCIRGPEDRGDSQLGYRWLPAEEFFPFYELRAAAVDLRRGGRFDPVEMRKRIRAQFQTCIENNVRHVILSAFGCGAFLNPAADVAAIYQSELHSYSDKFDCVTFAIFHAGYGPDNFAPFKEVFGI